MEYRESDSYESEDDEGYNTVGTQLMNNESIGASQDNTYEQPEYMPDMGMNAQELARYVSAQSALDASRVVNE